MYILNSQYICLLQQEWQPLKVNKASAPEFPSTNNVTEIPTYAEQTCINQGSILLSLLIHSLPHTTAF